jgi:hypothetical protein
METRSATPLYTSVESFLQGRRDSKVMNRPAQGEGIISLVWDRVDCCGRRDLQSLTPLEPFWWVGWSQIRTQQERKRSKDWFPCHPPQTMMPILMEL